MSVPSVGAPEFEIDDVRVLAPELPDDRPQPAGRSLIIPVVVAATVGVAITLFALGATRDRPDPAPLADDTPSTTTTIDPVPDSLFVEQRSAGAGYTVRPVRSYSPFVATETPDGFFGLRRHEPSGVFVSMTSPDGINWTTDIDSPLSGVPDTFRPGARRWGPEPLQYVDGLFWGRFVSDRIAGASQATLMLQSEDGVNWEGIDGVPVTLDDAWFADINFSRPDDFEIRGDEVYALSPINAPLVFTVPDIDSADWRIADVASGSAGAAVLFYNDSNLSFRVATTVDGETWETTGLEEHGEVAVEIVVVGTESVLLRAANIEKGPTELIIPLPETPVDETTTTPVDETTTSGVLVEEIDFLPAHIAPIGDVFVGLVGSDESNDELRSFYASDGISWGEAGAMPTVGLPAGAVPVGLWPTTQIGVIGAFTDPEGHGLTLASSDTGIGWRLGPTIGAGAEVLITAITPTRTGLFVSVDVRAPDRPALEHYRWNLASNDLTEIDLAPNLLITAAADSAFGLVAAVLSVDEPSAGTRFLLLDASGEWLTLDAQSDILFVAELIPTRSQRLLVLSHGGVHEAAWDGLLDGDEDVDWQFVTQIGDGNVGTFGLRDLIVGPRGAAALISRLDEPDRVTVLVTRDYATWTEVDAGLVGDRASNARLMSISRNNVIVAGPARTGGPAFAAVVPLDGPS